MTKNDYTAKLDIADLPSNQHIFYRVIFEDLAQPGIKSEPAEGSFMTVPTNERDVRFVWSGSST